MVPIDASPNEVFVEILSHGDEFTLGRWGCLNTRFQKLVNREDDLWKLLIDSIFGQFIPSLEGTNRSFLVSHLTLVSNIQKLNRNKVLLNESQTVGVFSDVDVINNFVVIPNKFGFTIFDRITGEKQYERVISGNSEVITTVLESNLVATHLNTFPRTTVTIWDPITGDAIFSTECDVSKVVCRDGKIFFSKDQHTFEVWDLFKNIRIHCLQIPSQVQNMMVLNDMIILCCEGNLVLGFDMEGGTFCYKLSFQKDITAYFQKDITAYFQKDITAFMFSQFFLIQEEGENTLKCFNSYTGNEERAFPIGEWEPTGSSNKVAVYDKMIVASAQDLSGAFNVWDYETGGLLQTINFNDSEEGIVGQYSPFHPEKIYVHYKYLIFFSQENGTQMVIWDLKENKLVAVNELVKTFDVAGIDDNILCLSSRQILKFYKLSTGELLRSYYLRNHGGVSFKKGVVTYIDSLEEEKASYGLIDFRIGKVPLDDLYSQVFIRK